MTDLRAAAQQALDAWDRPHGINYIDFRPYMDALRAALAEPVQEPVAWMVYTLDGQSVYVTDNPADFTPEHRALPLYTTPPQRKPLSHGEFLDIWQKAYEPGHRDFVIAERVARAVEAAHGIKE